MNLVSKCVPFGALPYENVDLAARMQAKLFEKTPYLSLLPVIDSETTIVTHTLGNIPGIKIKDRKIVLKPASSAYKQALSDLDRAYNNPEKECLDKFKIEAPFTEKYFQLIKKFKAKNPYINLLGPFTISQMLMSAAEEQMLADKSFRKLFIQLVAVRALWAIDKIREYSSDAVPVIMLEEPMLGQLGTIKRENEDVTVDLVTNMLAKVVEKIKSTGAIVGVQSFEKCDWKIPMNAGVDIISFDAYNNPNNLNIIPEQVTEFLSRGGRINWGIIPVMTESIVKSLNIDMVEKRLFATFDGLILSGVPEKLVYNSALVSVQGDLGKLPIIFAEKALIFSTQLAKRIPVKA